MIRRLTSLLLFAALAAVLGIATLILLRAQYPDVAWVQSFWLGWFVLPGLWLVSLAGAGAALALGLLRRYGGLLIMGLMACGCLILLIAADDRQFRHEQAEIFRQADLLRDIRRAQREGALARSAEQAAYNRALWNDRFSVYEGQVPPEVLRQLRAVDQEVTETTALAVEAAIDTFFAPEDPLMQELAGNPSSAELEALSLHYASVLDATRSAQDLIANLADRYDKALQPLALEGYALTVAEAEKARLLQDPSLADVQEFLQALYQLALATDEMVDFLAQQQGRWTVGENGYYTFEDSAAQEVFLYLATEVVDLEQAFWERFRELDKQVDRP